MTRTWSKRRVGSALVALASIAMVATGCGSSSDSASAAGDKSITLGIIPSWTDGLSTAYLWKDVLEKKGYNVDIKEISDAAPLYAGLAKGDVDVYPSAWPEVTHKSYMDRYGDNIEDLGTYYDGAKLTFAVPEYTDIDSIADLPGKADQFDGKIIGIEPGAGLTKTTKEQVMPQYGLTDDYSLVTSSTTAMLAQLKKATDSHQDIVVTLWKPFWANNAFPVKTLDDPKGALGEAEGLHELGRKGFSDDFPKVAAMMGRLKLDDAQYGSLEDLVVNKYGKGKEEQAVQAWEKDHQDVMDSLES
ncbi:glycine betaine ABC transporter substrate-binding protein [Nocardioides panaciterrulae]|uniref:Glycine betaine/proline transport system substrate-binding protein n=1 Tax=Nocardioides panaciterrulae TaxID=661492 RepID=A0A7Y9E5Q4_9ACTN|nr:glycine betaine ABC transporter substrate-binding protein [Nocardioides panaciterrulae]NYD41326.1 glycine betaine/proline transport system substrate-binding protein [Nocardioides panaciterrulae]